MKKCKICKKELVGYPSVIKKRIYCSNRCRASDAWYTFKPNHGMNVGSNNPNWSGGKMHDNRGYVKVWVPDHPKKDINNYVFEHRVVMEKQIGRFLTDEEVVHHINGIKDDNRVDNLELFANNAEHMKHEHESGTFNDVVEGLNKAQ